MTGALDDIRVLDATGPIGHYAGRLLADLGADVIKIEPIEGDPARQWAPMLPNVDAPEGALQYILLNANKRGIRLDVGSESGRAVFLRLVASCDVLLDSWQPQELTALGLSQQALLEAKPDLVRTSITGWGLTGPRAEWAYADIVGLAMSGVMNLAGFPEGPPEQIADHQGYHSASIDAAAGTVAALLHRDATGESEFVEVSMQEALSIAQETAMMQADILGTDRERTGGGGLMGIRMPGVGLHEASDGHVFLLGLGTAGSGFRGLLQLMDAYDGAGDLHEEPYATLIEESMNRATIADLFNQPEGSELIEMLAHIDGVVRDFCRQHPKRLLYEEGQKLRLLVGMVSSPRDISESPQLAAREWFLELEDPGRGVTLRFPGFPWQLKGTPATLRRPAPLLGEHNDEVLGELGLSQAEIGELVAAEVI